MRIRWKI